jgi:hypothetical protein
MSENEYKELVLADYDRKMEAGLLPAELISPAPGNLKAECVKICERRFNPKDEILLRSFFNQKGDAAAYRMAILNGSADIFRPLNKLLRKRSTNTSVKNINLLAWLIDFEPRPYHPNLRYKARPDGTPSASGPGSLSAGSDVGNIESEYNQHSTVKTWKKIIFYVLTIATIALVSYIFIEHKSNQLTGHEGCMIWVDDHYQPIDCGEKSLSSPLYHINHQLVDNFRKIMTPDTLTPRSIGKVWYAKFNGRVEFFTSAGPYPLDTNRRVLPMSDHILEKYVYHVKN